MTLQARFDTAGSQLSAGASAGATTLTVATTLGDLWQQASSISGLFPSTTFFDDFPTIGAGATVLSSSTYGLYNSVGNAGFGFRRPAQISVVASSDPSNGKSLQIRAENVGGAMWSGGMELLLPATYGQWETYVTADDDASAVTSPVMLLWSPDNDWPRRGEVDFYENFDPTTRSTRLPIEYNVHRLNPAAVFPYSPSDDQLIDSGTYTGIDGSAGHKYAMSWTPLELYVEIDNGPKIVLSSDPSHIPQWPMSLRLQLDAWSSTPPTVPVNMQFRYLLFRPYVAPTEAFDILVGGVRVTCYGISGSSSPQTFTTTPMPRAVASGATVKLADPAYYEL